MRKSINFHGVDCAVVITKNAKVKTIEGHNRVLHEEFSRQVDVHICSGYIGKQVISEEFMEWSPEAIEKIVISVETFLERQVRLKKSEESNEDKVNKKLKELGF